ncbi:MAG: hypothetical protein COX51_05410 [Syntrophobacteraceae bacterium CG23_combo_of_CG06-09_8_20_14_all_50_8]|nr:MAG: hypothetical protein COX51_05410 [Syntrophobacteraceae bacterium CG23_combo_of_CG06-09_8_20_14_all_50_8]
MVEKAFHDFVKELCFYYERKEPREQALDLWFTEVKHIPDEPLDWMRAQISSRHESYPKNLPVVMRELWQQWLENHPKKRAHGSTTADCQDCDGAGIITLYREGYRYVFRCGKCQQSNLNGIPVAFLANLEVRGYTLTNTMRKNRQSYG